MSETQNKPLLFPESKCGVFLLIPLKHSHSAKAIASLSIPGKKCPVESEDINESIIQTINTPYTPHSVTRYEFSETTLLRIATGISPDQGIPQLYATAPGQEGTPEDCRFTLFRSELYLFASGIAFFTLRFTYPNPIVLRRICNLGYTKSDAVYRYCFGNACQDFDLDERFRSFFESHGLTPFSKPGSPLYVESHIFNVGVVRNRFSDLDTIRIGAKNLHLMEGLNNLVDDNSEEDVYYTYSVKTQELGTHRFGYCVTSQTLSYLVANPELNLTEEMDDQRKNILPMVLLALYQKYTCLYFRERLSLLPENSRKDLQKLKFDMMEFQAYGTFPPAEISRWHNNKQTYKYILDTNGIPEAVKNLSLSLNILAEREKEFEEQEEKDRDRKSNLVLYLISLFGIISIPESVLSLVTYFVEKQWFQAILCSSLLLILLVLIVSILIFWKKKN
ncbi:MAG: hypothetical protein IKM13_02240 [Clostridia bacterium]|nr:hypothetical protein [Clostridia bacterium]